MKKTLLFVCSFISFATISQAQITKGSILLGGNIGLSKGKTEGINTSNSRSQMLSFNPTVGLAVKDNWVVGIHAGFSDFEAEPTISFSSDRDEEYYSAGVFLRRYKALGKNFYLYGNGSINYNKVNRTYRSGNYSDNYIQNYFGSKGVTLSVSPGITYTINKRFHLELSLVDLLTAGYSKTQEQNLSYSNGIVISNSTHGKSFDFGTNFSNTIPLSIGFRFVIGK